MTLSLPLTRLYSLPDSWPAYYFLLILPLFTTHTDSLLVTFMRKSVPQYMTPSFGL